MKRHFKSTILYFQFQGASLLYIRTAITCHAYLGEGTCRALCAFEVINPMIALRHKILHCHAIDSYRLSIPRPAYCCCCPLSLSMMVSWSFGLPATGPVDAARISAFIPFIQCNAMQFIPPAPISSRRRRDRSGSHWTRLAWATVSLPLVFYSPLLVDKKIRSGLTES